MNWKQFFSVAGWIFASLAFLGEVGEWLARPAVTPTQPGMHRMTLDVWPQNGFGDPITYGARVLGCDVHLVLAATIATLLAACLYEALRIELAKWRVEELELRRLFEEPGSGR